MAISGRVNVISEEGVAFSFTNVFVAMLAADDRTSRWFQEYVGYSEADMDELLKSKNMSAQDLASLRDQSSQLGVPIPGNFTASAARLFDQAFELKDKTDSNTQALDDVRHILAALIYYPGDHADQISAWGLNQAEWSNHFLGFIRQTYHEELDHWRHIHLEVLGVQSAPVAMPASLGGHISTDLWTTEDTLGYGALAYALARFIDGDETKPPLTIGLQAPWGGGKTSMMRQIQMILDPAAVPKPPGTATGTEISNAEGSDQKQGGFSLSNALRTAFNAVTLRNRGDLHKDRLTVRDALKDVLNMENILSRDGSKRFAWTETPSERITIWFNPWKYRSAEQVWAGLADTIMQQIAERLSPRGKQQFWMHLRMKRLEANQTRSVIQNQRRTELLRRVSTWVIGSLPVLIGTATAGTAGIATGNSAVAAIGWSGAVVTFVTNIGNVFWTWVKTGTEPVENSFPDMVSPLDYSKNTGMLHQVEQDLKLVFDAIFTSGKPKPVVIFIDDLDRCPPEQVVEVLEALNLFVNLEFMRTIFVLGMDPNLVAKAIGVRLKASFGNDTDGSNTLDGWRFMDKFVQIPVVLPPPQDESIKRYIDTLFPDLNGKGQQRKSLTDAVGSITSGLLDPADTDLEMKRLVEEHGLDELEGQQLKEEIVRVSIQSGIDNDVEKFAAHRPEIMKLLRESGPKFSQNPRELKRVFNVLRLQMSLGSLRRFRGIAEPSMTQLLSWAVLTVKWPSLAEWLRRNPANQAIAQTICKFEKLAKDPNKAEDWLKNITQDAELCPQGASWASDADLFSFFKREVKKPDAERLSTAPPGSLW